MKHSAWPHACSQCQSMSALRQTSYMGHRSPFTTQKIEGRQKGNKVGSLVLEGTLNNETRYLGSGPVLLNRLGQIRYYSVLRFSCQ